MSSFSRNSRRAHSPSFPRALGAALALALASGTALADGEHQFVFTAYSDAAGGTEVIAGRYRDALEELHWQADTMNIDPAATDTNRCVAYSMTLRWRQAHAACDAAVREASQQRYTAPAWLSRTQKTEDEYLAVAYANRAVMHWMWHDETAAGKDLAKAQELAPQADFVARNVAALGLRVTVARDVGATRKSRS